MSARSRAIAQDLDFAAERKTTATRVAREMLHQSRFGLPAARRLALSVAATLFATSLGSVSSAGTPEGAPAQAEVTEEEAGAHYVSNLRRALETHLLPALRAGIMRVATSKPPSLTIDVTDDPSPYHIGARVAPDGSLSVRLSSH